MERLYLNGLERAKSTFWINNYDRPQKNLRLLANAEGCVRSGAFRPASACRFGPDRGFVALIISKLVLVVVFLIAITQVSTPIEADLSSVTEPISGIVLLFIAAFAPYMVYRFISFLGFDLYHAMGSEQEAKSAVNRPVPVPSKPQSDGVKKVLDGGSGGGATPNATPAATGAPSTSASAAGAGAGSGAGASGAAAAAGPAAAAVIGAKVIKGAATAGPQLGGAVGGTAESAASGAGGSGAASAAPPSTPQPPTPRTDPAPPSTQPPQPRTTGKE